MNVEIRILDSRIEKWGFPYYGSEMAAGLDLFACIDEPMRLLPQGRPHLISSGFSMCIASSEWCALITPRSGIAHSKGLVLGNSLGVIDADYDGPCLVSAWNRNPLAIDGGNVIVINPGDRIAQMIFCRIVRPKFKVVPEFSHAGKRSGQGFGSTGM